MRQFHIAETEKYAHVTFFFNGRTEQPFPGEDRVLVQSPKVPTYDMMPEMSAYGVVEELTKRIRSGEYDFIVANFANGDMVGHSGKLEAAIKACEVVDECVGKVVTAIRDAGGVLMITADHGNCEMMVDPQTGRATHLPHSQSCAVYTGRSRGQPAAPCRICGAAVGCATSA